LAQGHFRRKNADYGYRFSWFPWIISSESSRFNGLYGKSREHLFSLWGRR
jgi:hypothetical protein